MKNFTLFGSEVLELQLNTHQHQNVDELKLYKLNEKC